jgi:hypothetical protein
MVSADNASDKMRKFREERLTNIAEYKTPIPLFGNARLFEQNTKYDLYIPYS